MSRKSGGTYVPLGRDEDAARVVWQGRDIDFSSFREGAETIEEELAKRDITVNSMAVSLDCLLRRDQAGGGFAYGGNHRPGRRPGRSGSELVRVTSAEAFHSDPLRLLRVYRFAATLGFTVDDATEQLVAARRT